MAKRIIQVEEKVPANLLIPLSIQHMFAMFGASVLVPFLFGINPAIVLFMNGIGTLLFIFITKGKAPAYLEVACLHCSRKYHYRKIWISIRMWWICCGWFLRMFIGNDHQEIWNKMD